MSEQTPLIRQWTLLRLLCSRHFGISVKEMAEEMSVGDKTIRRDLETFVTAGFPLEETVGQRGRKTWRINADKNQPWLTFAYDEAVALYLGRQFLEPLAGTLLWEAAQKAFKKIRASLGKDALKYIECFAGMFHQTAVGVHDYTQKADVIDQLMLGIEDRRAVFITYQSLRATEPVTYDVYPYGLVYHRGSLYLVGRAPKYDDIRHWKVDRMQDAEVTRFPFNPPDGFDIHQHLKHSFGVFHGDGIVRVRIRFSPAVATYVSESKWHESQKLTRQKDGSVLAEFHLSTTEEIKRWVLSFGAAAVVLEPDSLREEILDELGSLFTEYGRGDGRSAGFSGERQKAIHNGKPG